MIFKSSIHKKNTLGIKDLCFGATRQGHWGSFALGIWEWGVGEVYPVQISGEARSSTLSGMFSGAIPFVTKLPGFQEALDGGQEPGLWNPASQLISCVSESSNIIALCLSFLICKVGQQAGVRIKGVT